MKIDAPWQGWIYLGAMIACILLGILGLWAMAARDYDRRQYHADLQSLTAAFDSLTKMPCQFTPDRRCVYPLAPRDTIRRGTR